MAKKRKTLPSEFGELVKNGTLEEQQAMMLRCLPNATGDYNKYNAFGFQGISEEFAKWLIDYGSDINQPDTFGYTPLHHMAMARDGNRQIELYLSLGAHINTPSHLNGGPLHGATDHGCTENVKILLDHGADMNAKDRWGNTPLEFALGRCRGADLINKIDAVEALISAGASVTEKVKGDAKRIAADIEFRRGSFSEEWERAIDNVLARLYKFSGIEPLPKRRFHDGKSPITVAGQTWQKQYQELWDYLVPSSGPCQTVQGEVIRINGRLGHELLDNGGMNWDKDFKNMLYALKKYLSQGEPLAESDMKAVTQLTSTINGKTLEETVLNQLCQLSVKWVLKNPMPIPLGETDYRR